MAIVMGWIGRKRGAAIVLAVVLAAAALAAVLGAVAVAAPLGFLHVRFDLSQTASLISAYPDLAVSANGNRVAAVWTEGYSANTFKGHVYLRTASETGGGWGSRIRVFTGTADMCAYRAAVAITETTAHVAYVVFNDTCNDPKWVYLRYGTCSLASGQCGNWQDVYTERSDQTGYLITHVDIALGEGGAPHVVWGQYKKDETVGNIMYSTRSGAGWSSGQYVNLAEGRISRKPAIAWADDYVHVAWEAEGGDGYAIMYRRREDESGKWDNNVVPVVPPRLGPPLGNPDVAAGAGHIFVVWDWCVEESNDRCLRYNVVYARSNLSGTWAFSDWREVGTGNSTGWEDYYSTDVVDALPDKAQYLLDLNPSVVLNRTGWPTVVWHADRSEGMYTDYAIYYSYAITGTATDAVWVTRTVLSEGQPTMLGRAVVGVGELRPGEQHLHVAYMGKLSTGAWDVYYDSNERDQYKYIYLPLVMRGR